MLHEGERQADGAGDRTDKPGDDCARDDLEHAQDRTRHVRQTVCRSSTSAGALSGLGQRLVGRAHSPGGDGISLADCRRQIKSHGTSVPTIECRRMAAPADTGTASRTLVTHPELQSRQSFPVFTTIGEAPKSALERFLSIFADVRAGEGIGVLVLALNVFLLLGGYYWLRSARQGLILTDGTLFGLNGPQLAAASAAAQAVLLTGVVPLYGWLASRVPRMRLITITTAFFVVNLVLFYLGGQLQLREGVVFYIWIGIYNVFIVAQFWAFANDLYTEGQGRRLFPLIGVGASVGALVGAATVRPLVQGRGFTPYTLMLAA